MKPQDKDKRSGRHSSIPVVMEAAAGAVAGAAIGTTAGPPGIVAGALIGGAMGAAAGMASERGEAQRLATTKRLDEETGVVGGDIGAPNLEHPPAKPAKE